MGIWSVAPHDPRASILRIRADALEHRGIREGEALVLGVGAGVAFALMFMLAVASSEEKPKQTRKGHGRNGASKYTGADKQQMAVRQVDWFGVLGIGVAWGTPRRSVLPMVAIAAGSWLIVALAAALVSWIYIRFTTWGYETRAVGANEKASRFLGIPVNVAAVVEVRNL